jgi:RND superfamily putative drug exporter
MIRSASVTRRSQGLAQSLPAWVAERDALEDGPWAAHLRRVAFAVGGMVGTKTIDTNGPGPGESGRMDKILDAGFKQPAGESVLVQSSSLRVNDPAFIAAVDDVVERVSKVSAVQDVRSALPARGRGMERP